MSRNAPVTDYCNHQPTHVILNNGFKLNSVFTKSCVENFIFICTGTM